MPSEPSRSAHGLAWAMRRATAELRALGLEWARGRERDGRTIALRLRIEGARLRIPGAELG